MGTHPIFVSVFDCLTGSGYLFRKGRLKIVVSKLCKMKEPGKTDDNSLIPITQSHLIEASITVPTGSEDPGRELLAFADQMKPLVNMEKTELEKIRRGI